MIMIHGYCYWDIFWLFKCYFAVPIPLTRKIRKKHTRLFFLEKSWAKFFLKPFVFFNSIVELYIYIIDKRVQCTLFPKCIGTS